MASRTRPYRETLEEYGRGIVGGLIFALAPLYTAEVWWQGFRAPPNVLLLAVGVTFVVLVAYAHYVGLHNDRDLLDNVYEAFEAIAIGFVVAWVFLKLVGQLPGHISDVEYISRLTIEGLTAAIGVSVGSAQLGEESSEDEGEARYGSVHETAYSVLGAILLVAGFAPTQEILIIALEARPWAVLGTAVLTFALALGVMSYFGFRGSPKRQRSAYAGGPLGDACVTYAIGLAVAAVLLWSVGRFDGVGLGAMVCMTVYLALPATIGGSVGRLIL